MNSNYQVNKFYAQERMNAHLKAAQAHRQARKANSESGASSVRYAVVRVYGWAGSAISQFAQVLERLGNTSVSSHHPRLH